MVPSSEETSFWPPSMVYISVIITYITNYSSSCYLSPQLQLGLLQRGRIKAIKHQTVWKLETRTSPEKYTLELSSSPLCFVFVVPSLGPHQKHVKNVAQFARVSNMSNLQRWLMSTLTMFLFYLFTCPATQKESIEYNIFYR